MVQNRRNCLLSSRSMTEMPDSPLSQRLPARLSRAAAEITCKPKTKRRIGLDPLGGGRRTQRDVKLHFAKGEFGGHASLYFITALLPEPRTDFTLSR